VGFFTHFDARTLYRIPGLVANSQLPSFTFGGPFARVTGLAAHPIEYGVVLAFFLPIVVHYVLATPKPDSKRWRILLAIIGVAIPTSLSRSALLAVLTVAIVLGSVWTWRLRVRALAWSVGFLLALQAVVPGLLGTLISLFTNFGQDPSVQGRKDDYSVVGRFISTYPLFGRGFQTFIPTRYITLDNQYIGTVIELGFIGLAAVIAVLLIAIFTARGARRRSTDPRSRHLAQAFVASFAAVVVTFATFDAFGYQMICGSLFLVIGVAGALWRLTVEESVPVAQPSRRQPVTV
jgi:O-antigen ligase